MTMRAIFAIYVLTVGIFSESLENTPVLADFCSKDAEHFYNNNLPLLYPKITIRNPDSKYPILVVVLSDKEASLIGEIDLIVLDNKFNGKRIYEKRKKIPNKSTYPSIFEVAFSLGNLKENENYFMKIFSIDRHKLMGPKIAFDNQYFHSFQTKKSAPILVAQLETNKYVKMSEGKYKLAMKTISEDYNIIADNVDLEFPNNVKARMSCEKSNQGPECIAVLPFYVSYCQTLEAIAIPVIADGRVGLKSRFSIIPKPNTLLATIDEIRLVEMNEGTDVKRSQTSALLMSVLHIHIPKICLFTAKFTVYVNEISVFEETIQPRGFQTILHVEFSNRFLKHINSGVKEADIKLEIKIDNGKDDQYTQRIVKNMQFLNKNLDKF